MVKLGNLELGEQLLLLAPMEDVTDVSFRLLARELGADAVYTEFISSEAIIRAAAKSMKKLVTSPAERPVAIQIYGGDPVVMQQAARISEAAGPDFIDINCGCWVKNVVRHNAGAGLLKDPERMARMVRAVVDAVKLPVTVKTRIGWDANTINILEIAPMLEQAGAQALTIHCRTRVQGHSGDADWSWIPKIKQVVSIPVALNGSIFTAEDVKKAFEETNADAIMIARGAIGNPRIFKETKEILSKGIVETVIDEELRIKTTLRHLKLAVDVKGEKRAVLEHRKFYTGYLKGLHNASHVRKELMSVCEYSPVEDLLLKYLQELLSYRCAV